MSYFRIIIFVLSISCFCVSCTSVGLSDNSSQNALSATAQPATIPEKIETSTDNSISNNQNIVTDRNTSSTTNNKLSRQIKPRRENIKFPDECNYHLANATGKDLLEASCTAALYNIQTELPKECNYEQDQYADGHFNFADYGAEFYPLSPNKYLVEVRCTTGAYNLINIYLLYDESAIPAKAEVLEFPGFEFTRDENSDVVKSIKKISVKKIHGVFFNRKTKELSSFYKGRGIGDAGEYARYSFPNGKPKLEELRADFKDGCPCYQTNEIIKNPPKSWKRYYPQ